MLLRSATGEKQRVTARKERRNRYVRRKKNENQLPRKKIAREDRIVGSVELPRFNSVNPPLHLSELTTFCTTLRLQPQPRESYFIYVIPQRKAFHLIFSK